MTLDLAHLQFAATSVYHFLFAPIAMGLAWLVTDTVRPTASKTLAMALLGAAL